MRAFKHDGRLFQILFAALLCASIFPDRLLADDKDTSNPPAKAAPAKSDAPKMEAPAPLTERERWLLDRVELLEKRVEELEAKSRPAARFSERSYISCRSGHSEYHLWSNAGEFGLSFERSLRCG